MSNPFDFFEKKYCINLDRRTDKWKASCEEFAKVDIEHQVERFSAFDRENGLTGCRLSHIAVWHEVAKLGLKNALIMEDDVQFLPETIETLTEAIKELPQDWEILFLGSTVGRVVKRESPHLARIEYALAGHCYAINSTVYPYLLQVPSPSQPWGCPAIVDNEAIDVWLSEKIVARKNAFHTLPILALQRPGWSDIDKKMTNYTNLMYGRFEENMKSIFTSSLQDHPNLKPWGQNYDTTKI